MENKRILLKDKYFSIEKIEYLSNLIKSVYFDFDEINFKNDILVEMKSCELLERVYLISKILKKYLKLSYIENVEILIKSLPENSVKNYYEFLFASYSDYIYKNGLSDEFLDFSLNALLKFTKYFSAEFAIRYFINKYPKQTFDKLLECSKSSDLHLRRLASEGFRPKLPWGKSINFDYKKPIEILNNLFYDDSKYVIRSVANHLNDISKFDSKYVIEILSRWRENEMQNNNNNMDYLIYHSLRTLIKKSDSLTFEFLGYNMKADVEVLMFEIEKYRIKLGEYLNFSFEIISKYDEKLIVDYKIIYPQNKIYNSFKIFKLKKMKMKKNEKIKIFKKHLFKKMTTKKLYPGIYELIIITNGSEKLKKKFEII